jgi:predicted N-acetyltransferase YhbS
MSKRDGLENPRVTFRPTRTEDKEAVLRMLERSTGLKQDPELWEWLFHGNTSNHQMHGFVAEAEGAVVAQHATLPVRLSHAGDDLPALSELQVATDPAFQGRGIFTALGARLQADVASEWPVMFGFPNRASAPIYYDRLGWVELRPFPVLVRPLGNTRGSVSEWRPRLSPLAKVADALAPVALAPARAAARLAERTGARVVAVHSFEAWADELWRELRPFLGTCAIRDAAFLRWRFQATPLRDQYTLYGLDRGSGPVGFAVLNLRPGLLADLMELMVPPGDSSGAQLLLARAIGDAWASGTPALRAIVSPRHPHRGAFRKLGFLQMPARLKPKAGYSFGVCVLNRSLVISNALLHIDDWYLSGADLDYI